MKSSGVELTIGELAGRFGLGTHVVRHWESVGLIAPARRVNRWRRYGRDALARVTAILLGKRAGLGLAEIRTMLDATDPADRRQILRRQHDQLERRIAEARAAQELIEHGLACSYDDFLECPNFQALIAEWAGEPCDGPVRTCRLAHART